MSTGSGSHGKARGAGISAFLAVALSVVTPAATLAEEASARKQADYSSAQDWPLEAGNIIPHGRNPLFFPLLPGHKHILEGTDRSGDKYRRETMVLEKTEAFDVRGLGNFDTAIVQDEEFIDGDLAFRIHSWIAIDKVTNSVHLFGRLSWEVDEQGEATVADTWRVGEADAGKPIEPGLLMPGTLTVGSRFAIGGKQGEPVAGLEAVATGLEISVPAGSFKDCVRLREQNWADGQHETVERTWCRGVGLVSEQSHGQLIASNALPATHSGADVSSFGKLVADKQAAPPPDPKISSEQAKEAALKVVAGRVTSVVIERKRGKHVYVVEIMTRNSGEKDVLVDIDTGEVIGTE